MPVCLQVGAIAARAGQKILFLFCSWFLQKKKEDFLRLAKRTLVSFGNQTCNFAIMFGVFGMMIFRNLILGMFQDAIKDEVEK